MTLPDNGPDAGPQALVEDAATRLHGTLVQLASLLDPFPAFMNMASLQAVELEPPRDVSGGLADLGCVVVLPSGEIAELELKAIPGANGPSDIDQVEEFRELDLKPEQYIRFAASAIHVLYEEVRRRGLA